jgi:hypothetical protein
MAAQPDLERMREIYQQITAILATLSTNMYRKVEEGVKQEFAQLMRELVAASGMNRNEFARAFEIPWITLTRWTSDDPTERHIPREASRHYIERIGYFVTTGKPFVERTPFVLGPYRLDEVGDEINHPETIRVWHAVYQLPDNPDEYARELLEVFDFTKPTERYFVSFDRTWGSGVFSCLVEAVKWQLFAQGVLNDELFLSQGVKGRLVGISQDPHCFAFPIAIYTVGYLIERRDGSKLGYLGHVCEPAKLIHLQGKPYANCSPKIYLRLIDATADAWFEHLSRLDGVRQHHDQMRMAMGLPINLVTYEVPSRK